MFRSAAARHRIRTYTLAPNRSDDPDHNHLLVHPCTSVPRFKHCLSEATRCRGRAMASHGLEEPALQRSSSQRTDSDASVFSYPDIRVMNKLSQKIDTAQGFLARDKKSQRLSLAQEAEFGIHEVYFAPTRRNDAKCIDTSNSHFDNLQLRESLDRLSQREVSRSAVGSTNSRKSSRHRNSIRASFSLRLRRQTSVPDLLASQAGNIHGEKTWKMGLDTNRSSPGEESTSILHRARGFVSRSLRRTKRPMKVSPIWLHIMLI